MANWEFYIDRGGTFTDVVARDPQGKFHIQKLLSSDTAPLVAIRAILGLPEGEAIPPLTIKLGSTVGTNALLERKGKPLALLITQGFRHLLEIGYQNRPHLFDLHIQKPGPLYERVVEVPERIGPDGAVIRPLNILRLERILQALLATGLRDLAVVFLHGYRYPAHEAQVERRALQLGFESVQVSHKVSPQVKILPRGDTTVLDGYLTPTIQTYLQKLQKALPDSHIQVMQSHGGLVHLSQFRGKDSLLSGPAGGVVGCAQTAMSAGFSKVIGFDMGGTSTDVSRFDGQYEMVYQSEKAGVRIQAPLLNIETVASGGGSLIHFDGLRLQVGPQSAGADPGPICYGRGGTHPSITDANLLLGRIVPAYFKKFPLQIEPVREAFDRLAKKMTEKTDRAFSPEEVALGALEIANNNMVSALRVISVARGYDPREYGLATFGGAGGQHACALARKLSIKKILIHPFASLLSALGMGMAPVKTTGEQTVHLPWQGDSLSKMENIFSLLQKEVEEKLAQDGSVAHLTIRLLCDMRYQGQSSCLTVEYKQDQTAQFFEELHQQRFGHIQKDRSLEVVTLRVEGLGETAPVPVVTPPEGEGDLEPRDFIDVYFSDGRKKIPLYFWDDFRKAHSVLGPAMILHQHLTVLVEPSFQATLDESGFLIIENLSLEEIKEKATTDRDPILLEIFSRLFSSVADQMGEALQNTAFSTNIKERLDFSCAIFDKQGELVANAAHIPVHLGAMSSAVKGLLQSEKPLAQADVYVTNNPFCGGSHLPDITVITPVFHGEDLVFFVANRGHHADIGGIVPGSMPAFSTSIEEEGILIDNFRLIEMGVPRYKELESLLLSGPYPARNLSERRSDLEAQMAANTKGVALLEDVIHHYTWPVVSAYMDHLRASAREKMENLLESYDDGQYSFTDFLDDGPQISVVISMEGKRAKIDFSGTSPQLKGNLNANPAIVKSAILYVFRTLLKEEIPLNSGCLEPMDIVIPSGCLLNPRGRVAVVGGNVETSQRICDVLFGALGACGASQGTMNNFTFGQKDFGYYETIGGGAGAGPGFDGAEGVHTHMTNTRMTDPEVFELRYPALIQEISLAPQTGGEGQWCGGRGIKKRFHFLDDLDGALLSERRILPPYGLKGGQPGSRGKNTLIRSGSLSIPLGGKSQFQIKKGDELVIQTPGGGGYGEAQKKIEEILSFAPFEIRGDHPTQIELSQMKNRVRELWSVFGQGLYLGPTAGLAPGFIQANLVVVPQQYSSAFLDFVRANSQSCPLLEVTAPGQFEPVVFGPSADLRIHLPQYWIHRPHRPPMEVFHILPFWSDDLVAFLLGCSFSFEGALLSAGIPLRHLEENKNVPMYITNQPCQARGPFAGPLVVSMRPLLPQFIDRAIEITENFPLGHGAPIQIGDPANLGIDLTKPDFGSAVTTREGEIPVFWACGVTPQVVLAQSGLPFYITHRPGHMFITDVWAE